VAVTLLVFLPSKDQTAQTSQPLTRLNPYGLKHLQSPEGSCNATSGTVWPPLIGWNLPSMWNTG